MKAPALCQFSLLLQNHHQQQNRALFCPAHASEWKGQHLSLEVQCGRTCRYKWGQTGRTSNSFHYAGLFSQENWINCRVFINPKLTAGTNGCTNLHVLAPFCTTFFWEFFFRKLERETTWGESPTVMPLSMRARAAQGSYGLTPLSADSFHFPSPVLWCYVINSTPWSHRQ